MAEQSPVAEPGTAIKDVQMFSTGSGKQHPEHRNGSWKPRIWWALTSRNWVPLPINVFVIQHRRGLILFDAGLDPAVAGDPNYVQSRIGRFFMRRLFRFKITPDDTIANNLQRLGYQTRDVCKVVISHLHFDHIGGIADVPDAELLVNKDEWRQLGKPHPDRDYIFPEHIDLPGAKWRPIEFMKSADPQLAPFGGCYDVMGDGSLMLLPTPGHTIGSMSMLVRSAGRPPLFLMGDLSYSAELLMKDQLPGTYADPSLLRASYAKVRALKQQIPELIVLGSHDPSAVELLATAFGHG